MGSLPRSLWPHHVVVCPLPPSRGVYDDARSLRGPRRDQRGDRPSHDTGFFLRPHDSGLHWAEYEPDEPTRPTTNHCDEPRGVSREPPRRRVFLDPTTLLRDQRGLCGRATTNHNTPHPHPGWIPCSACPEETGHRTLPTLKGTRERDPRERGWGPEKCWLGLWDCVRAQYRCSSAKFVFVFFGFVFSAVRVEGGCEPYDDQQRSCCHGPSGCMQ